MLLDFALMSGLLVAAHLLRYCVPLLQTWCIPTPIIAGFMGLAAGGQVLDWLPFDEPTPGAPSIAHYPSDLVILLFGTLFLGHRPRTGSLQDSLRRVGDTFFYNLACEIAQYGVALLFGLTVLAIWLPQLDSRFALMMPAGFVGGHGTATAIGGILQKSGWDDALSVGYTFATVGLLSGVFVGVALINLGTRKRWTRLVRAAHELPVGLRRGFLPPEERQSLGHETVSPIAMDPLSWHAALVFITYLGALGISAAGKRWLPERYNDLPLFALSMLVGAVLQWTLERFHVGQFVDRRVVGRIGSAVSDYLIAFGIASIKLDVVAEYAGPLAVMSLLGVAYALGMFWFIGRRVYHNYWFERSIFVFGWNTGVVGTGVTLLRVVDPRLRSGTLEDYGMAYVMISPFEIFFIIAVPTLVVQGFTLWTSLALIVGGAACIAVSARVVGWFTADPQAAREGEIDRDADDDA